MSFSQRLAAFRAALPAVPQAFTLLAVTKGVTEPVMLTAYEAGLTAFGESYWQEAMRKQAALSACAIEWHFIGRLQRNKCALIAEKFAWVHSVAHWHHAELLAEGRHQQAPLNICVQVNLQGEAQKEGIDPHEVVAFIRRLAGLKALSVRGLMYIPPRHQPPAFEAFTALFREVALAAPKPEVFDTISMGMSEDYPEALAAGSTLIRVGSKLFK